MRHRLQQTRFAFLLPPKARAKGRFLGFDHGVGHPLLLLCDTQALNCRKNKVLKDLNHYLSGRKWPTR
jgi:hypothetical protein